MWVSTNILFKRLTAKFRRITIQREMKGRIGLNLFNLRKMEIEDWPAVLRIHQMGMDTNLATFESQCPSKAIWDSHYHRACRLVAEYDGQVVGWAALLPVSHRAVFKGVAEVSIYVDEARQGMGIGSALLARLCCDSKAMGFWMLESVIMENNVGSIALHTKCGFRKVGYREHIAKDQKGHWRHVVLMELRHDIL